MPNGHLVISSEPFACSALDATAPRTAMRQGSGGIETRKERAVCIEVTARCCRNVVQTSSWRASLCRLALSSPRRFAAWVQLPTLSPRAAAIIWR